MINPYRIQTLICLFMLTALSACGFSPVHSSSSTGPNTAFQNITIETVETGNPAVDESGFFLKQRLRDRVGAGQGSHILRITPELNRAQLGFSGDDIASRNDLSLTANYELVDAASGDILDAGSVRSTSSFGTPVDAFGRQAAQDNATRTIAQETADRLLARLARFYASTPN